MHRSIQVAAGCAALAAVLISTHQPVSARGLGAAAELEAARANARAGGPVSARDAELLERHGCLSGTRSDFCRRLENRNYRVYRQKKRPRQ